MSDADKGPREIIQDEEYVCHGTNPRKLYSQDAYLALQKELDAMLNNRNHYCNVYQKTQKQLAEAQEQIKDYKSVLEKISQGPDIPLIKMSKAELLDFIARFAQRKARETLNKWKQSDT